MKAFFHNLKITLLVYVAHFVYWLLRSTWRMEEGEIPLEIQKRIDAGEAVVMAHWHEDEWALLGFYTHRRMIVLVSLSKDGSLMARFLDRFGYRVARGSSSRGAVAGLLNLVKFVHGENRKVVCLAVDGPRGPRRRSKKGIFKLAETLNAPMLSGCAVADRAWVFKRSWSKAFIPKPFARVKLIYAPVMSSEKIKLGVERDDYATLCYDLEESLKAAKVLGMNSFKNK